jgi:hypothetical protein
MAETEMQAAIRRQMWFLMAERLLVQGPEPELRHGAKRRRQYTADTL